MTGQPPGPGSPADEQRTTALPRRPARGDQQAAHGGQQAARGDERARQDQQRGQDQPDGTGGPGSGTGQPPAASGPRQPPAPPPDPAPYQDTTVLQRPPGPRPGPATNLPGAVRPAGPPPSAPDPRAWPAAPSGTNPAPGPAHGSGRNQPHGPAGNQPYGPAGNPAYGPGGDPGYGTGGQPYGASQDPRARRSGPAGPPYDPGPYQAAPPGSYDYDYDDDRSRDDQGGYRPRGRDDEPGYRERGEYRPRRREYADDPGYGDDRNRRGRYRDEPGHPEDYYRDRRRGYRDGPADDDGYRDGGDGDRDRPVRPDDDRADRRGRGRPRRRYPEEDDYLDDRPEPRRRRTASRPDEPHRTSHLPPYSAPLDEQPDTPDAPEPAAKPRTLGGRAPRKLTVTRVAALRSAELTHRGMVKFHGAVSADGADRSGLSHLTYAVMGNYAVDAALAVALANTLFFAAAKADSTSKVLLYLLLTVAPFAVIAPLIGPLLDRVQRGRRIALALSCFGRTVLAVTMAVKFDSWVIYPCALGMLVLSKSFGVLKSALTPRVLPEAMSLVKTNSRLTVFGLIAGGVSGAIAAGIAGLTSSAGALGFTAAVAVVEGLLCLRIPSWVESTEGEVPVEQRQRTHRHRVLPRPVAGALWTNSTIRIETGFLALFIAFVVKSRFSSSSVIATPGVTTPPPSDNETFQQLLLLGAIGAAAGLGGFLGNALGARLSLRAPQTVALVCLGGVIAAVLLAFLIPGLITAGAVALVGSTASSLAKVCLDSTIQQNLPEVSRASAFGRSESVLQLSWVFGGVIGLLIGGVWALTGDTVFMVGFGIIGLVMLASGAQCLALRTGRSLLPAFSLRGLLHRTPQHDTAPVARPATATPSGGQPAPGATTGRRAEPGPSASPQQQSQRQGRRPTRKAGRPR